jgi:cytochrome b
MSHEAAPSVSATTVREPATTAALAPARAYRVYDILQRVLHWTIAATIAGLAGTAALEDAAEWAGFSEDALWRIHSGVGYALIVALVLRVVWGIVGPRHARWSDMWHPDAWATAWRKRRLPQRPRLGHDPMASLAYLALYLVLGAMALTGLGLAAVELRMGPLVGWVGEGAGHGPLEEIHEIGATMILGFVAVHLVGMALYRLRHRVPVFGAMWHGRQVRRGDVATEAPKHDGKTRVVLGLAILLGAAGTAASAVAEEPADFLARYAVEAAHENRAFDRFDASRGRDLYQTSRINARGRNTSCAECHTPDPKAPGRTRAGKAIDALSPLADRRRFTDSAKVEKWFDRNCKDVLDRPCTATEKGDLLTFLLAAGS